VYIEGPDPDVAPFVELSGNVTQFAEDCQLPPVKFELAVVVKAAAVVY
jgi:hypothetical protein